MMTKRQCWRVVPNINCDPAFRDRFCQLLRRQHSVWISLQGSRQELLQRVEALRDALSKMSPDQLKMNEITEDDRHVQMSLYEKLSASLRAAK